MKWQNVPDNEFIEKSRDFDSQQSYARSFGLKKTTPAFRGRVKDLEIVFGKKELISREDFEHASRSSSSITELVEKMNGGEYKRSYYYTAHKLSKAYGIPLPKYSPSPAPVNRVPNDEFFVRDTKRPGPALRDRLLGEGRLYACSIDGCPLNAEETIVYVNRVPKVIWVGQYITLQVDHIDGDNLNNLRDNLRFLCPNCHAATETFTGKNVNRGIRTSNHCKDCGSTISRIGTRCKKCAGIKRSVDIQTTRQANTKAKYPEVSVMVRAIEDVGYLQYSKTLGVTDNAVRGYLRRRGVDPLPRRRSKMDIR